MGLVYLPRLIGDLFGTCVNMSDHIDPEGI